MKLMSLTQHLRMYQTSIVLLSVLVCSGFGAIVGISDTSGSSSSTTKYRRAQKIVSTAPGKITKVVMFHGAGTSGKKFELGVYDSSSTLPNNRLGYAAQTQIATTAKWDTLTLVSPVTVAANKVYWLAWVYDSASFPGVRYKSGTNGYATTSTYWSASGDTFNMPAVFGTSSAVSSYSFCIYAIYTPICTLVTSASTGGTISPSGTSTYDSGTTVTLTPTANSGYSFSGWSGDTSGTTNPLVITIKKKTTITANFTASGHSPTGITTNPSPLSINENNTAGTAISKLSSVDEDAGNTFTYSIRASVDSSKFTIRNDSLVASAVLNYENKSRDTVKIRTTDNTGLYFDSVFVVTVNNVNEPPTGLILSTASIMENKPAETVLGYLTAVDQDSSGTYSFSLYGGADQGSFGIERTNELVITAPFDFETKNTYTVIIRIQEQSFTYDTTLTIHVLDTTEYADPAMTPAAGSTLTDTSVTISWTAVPGAYTYKLEVGSTLSGHEYYNGTVGTATSAGVSGLPKNGSTIYCKLTTTDVGGSHVYSFTYTAILPESSPVAQSISIAYDTLKVGKTLTATYVYYDADGDVQDTSATTYQWYRADDTAGTNITAISGATSLTYVLTDADDGKYMKFGVTPHAKTGTTVGSESRSVYVGSVGSRDGLEYVYPKVCGANQNMKVDGNVKIVYGNLSLINGKINIKGWSIEEAPDYVFEKNYKLKGLDEVEAYVKEHKHLSDVPSATEMNKKGIDVTSMNMALLKKVEELTLYTIEQNKKLEMQNKRIEELEKKIRN